MKMVYGDLLEKLELVICLFIIVLLVGFMKITCPICQFEFHRLLALLVVHDSQFGSYMFNNQGSCGSG
jgi:hypothetical protein